MFPMSPINVGEGSAGFSYSGVYIAATRDHVLACLGELRFTGYVGPQEADWVLAIAGNPLGKVARGKRRIADVARDLATTLETVTLAVEVDKDARLRMWGFDGVDELPGYDSNPPDPDAHGGGLQLDDFGNPVMTSVFVDNEDVARALAVTFPSGSSSEDERADELAEMLDDDLGEDTSESERLTGILRILGLPTWIVSSDSLPRRVPGGPDKDQVTRLGAGKPGVQGRFAEAFTKPARPKRKNEQ